MDPIIILVLGLAVLAILYFAFRSAGGNPSEKGKSVGSDDVFEFDGSEENLATNVRRRVQIIAPAQPSGNGTRKISIEALPLPQTGELKPPESKGITELLVTVINPRAQYADTRQEVNDFANPLTMTIHYTAKEFAATDVGENGQPRLSIVVGYQDNAGWHFERLATTVSHNPETQGGTLTAQIQTLHPKDPAWISRP